MKQTLPTRALFTLSSSGSDLHVTYHLVRDPSADGLMPQSAAGRTGILIVNALSTPRSGNGGSSVSWAEAFAHCGFPCFRVDLAGLGDSGGGVTGELICFMTDGGYAALIREAVRELVDRFELAGIVVMGHCAGAVTALHAASEERLCKGLILMDPYFNYPKGVAKTLPRLALLSRNMKIFGVLRTTYDFARELPRAIRKDGLPPSANRALLSQWRRVASKGLPVLILNSPSSRPGPGQFDYLGYATRAAGRKARICVEFIESTDHSFANTAGREAVRSHAEAWLKSLFGVRFEPDRAPGRILCCSLSAERAGTEAAKNENVVEFMA